MATHERTQVFVEVQHQGRQQIAATIHWPAGEALQRRPPVLACFPGAGYNRRYFDLPEPGYSEAAHHVANGLIVIAIDHLATGDSSRPPSEHTQVRDVAAVNHAALMSLLEQLRSGALGASRARSLGPIIGVGHSMGGMVIAAMQAAHRSFDGVAFLGVSMVQTRLRSTTPWRELHLSPRVDPSSPEGFAALKEVNWRVTGHWEDVPENLVAADAAPDAPWRTPHLPNVGSPLQRATLSQEAAVIDVPVLFGYGEGDTCHDYLREIAPFQSTRDLAVFQVPRMAHIHNLAGTRRLMWARVDAFSRHVEAMTASA